MLDRVEPDQVRAMIDGSYTEAEFQAQVVQLAKANGWRWYHTHMTHDA